MEEQRQREQDRAAREAARLEREANPPEGPQEEPSLLDDENGDNVGPDPMFTVQASSRLQPKATARKATSAVPPTLRRRQSAVPPAPQPIPRTPLASISNHDAPRAIRTQSRSDNEFLDGEPVISREGNQGLPNSHRQNRQLPPPSDQNARTAVANSSAKGKGRDDSFDESSDDSGDDLYEPAPYDGASDGEQDDILEDEVVPEPCGNPSAATRGRKRPAPPQASAATVKMTKQRKTKAATVRVRPKASDFSALIQAILIVAVRHYRALIGAEYAYPDPVDVLEYVRSCWDIGCQAKGLEVELEPDHGAVITCRGSQMRGEVKREAARIVEQMYHININGDSAAQTGEKVRDLLAGIRFVFRDPEHRKGLYEHPAIQQVITRVFFKHKNDDGVHLRLYYGDHIPLATIALVLTAIENALDEWVTGKWKQLEFSEKNYKEKYDDHLSSLQQWQSAIPTAAEHVRAQLYRRALKKVLGDDEPPVQAFGRLDAADIEAARAEWENSEDA